MNISLILSTLAVFYLCILQAESKNEKRCTAAWFGGCKNAKKFKIVKISTRFSGCTKRCIGNSNCGGLDFANRARNKGKVGVCNLFKVGCKEAPNKNKIFLHCSIPPRRKVGDQLAPPNDDKVIDPPISTDINSKDCGLQFIATGGRVVGGKPAKRGQFPWQVGIFAKTDSTRRGGSEWYAGATGLKAHCGGSLINDRWVLTAAHCFRYPDARRKDNPDLYEVLLGRNNLAKEEDGSIRTGIKKIIIHPDWNPAKNGANKKSNAFDNDIALVELTESAKIAENTHLQTVCIPKRRKENLIVCQVSGWGQTMKPEEKSSDEESLKPVLQFAPLKWQDFEPCNRLYKSRVGSYNQLTKNQFCAGKKDGSMDSCQGDSGGPYVCAKSKKTDEVATNKFYQFGIVSFGDSCGKAKSLGQYTKVSKYYKWILRKAKL